MTRRNAATAADAQILPFEGGNVKRLRDRQRWLRALFDADWMAMVAHLPPRRRPSKAAILAGAAVIEVMACGGDGLFFASVGTLARAMGTSSTTARAVLHALENACWIVGERRKRAGRQDSDTTRYRLLPPPVAEGGTAVADAGYSSVASTCTPVAKAKSDTQRKTESARSPARDPTLAAWWSKVPRDQWDALYYQHRDSGEPFQSDNWKRRACEAES